jgi:DNA polymerase-3 subunit epsilon
VWDLLFGLDYRRRRLLARTSAGPLHNYLARPFASLKADCRRLEYLAVDLETTGLDARSDAIVSLGSVVMQRRLGIDLSTAQHRLVRLACAVPEASAVIHRITDDLAATGESLEVVLTDLLAQLAGRVLIAHHAKIELAFLSAACERCYGGRLLAPTIDTQWLAKRWLERRGKHYQGDDLRLSRLRARYNLPPYRSHDALMDALATAEVFAAQVAERTTERYLPLRDFLVRR